MEAGHVATHMIFHAITADQNARIRILHRGDHRGSAGNAPNVNTTAIRPPKRSKRIATLDITCSSQSRIFNGYFHSSIWFLQPHVHVHCRFLGIHTKGLWKMIEGTRSTRTSPRAHVNFDPQCEIEKHSM